MKILNLKRNLLHIFFGNIAVTIKTNKYEWVQFKYSFVQRKIFKILFAIIFILYFIQLDT